MRRLILLGLLAAMVLPAGAAKRVTVEQLEQALASGNAAHRADAEVARQIGDLELTERLTEVGLGRLAKNLTLGPRTALALQLLADQSAFLDPPAGELPATAKPDAATQQRIMDAARGYVAQALPRLPNFFATRTTNRFDDSAQVLEKGDYPVRAGMHLVGTVSRQITFRDGKEVEDAPAQTAATPAAPNAQQEIGLHTWGEFGPELSVVLTDTAKGTVTFSHWEQTATGLAAVYRYSVPRAASHYAVSYCCVLEQNMGIRRLGGARRGMAVSPNVPAAPNMPGVGANPFHETPGYHGMLSIDPGSGAVLRITLEAELKGDDPLTRAATVVQYAPVAIGERSYICPIRSLAFSQEQINANGRPGILPVLLVNETSFTHYHRLGTSMRMVADGMEPGSASQTAAAQPTSDASAGAVSTPGAAQPVAAPGAAAQRVANETPQAPAAAAPAPPPTAPAQPVIPEISLTAANGVPDLPVVPQPAEGEYALKMTSRLVDVGIVAYDKKGHPVRDLKPEDFEIYDNGRKQEVRFFSQLASEAAVPAAAAEPSQSFTNRSGSAAGEASSTGATEAGATVLLIDESHIAWADMSHARQEILKFLGTLAPGERVGLYTMTGLGFRVLQEITTDHAALTARLQKWMPTAQSAALAQEEETRNRQQFNEVHNVSDLASVNGNQVDQADSVTTVDPQLRTMGSNPARASLIILAGVARHLSAVNGHKNLVWVSSDNVFADWQNQAVGIDKSPKSVDSFALKAQEAMNDAHVAVFPLDTSQLESAAINADIRTRNVELNQAAMDNATASPYEAPGQGGRNLAPGRITAQMQQDMHPIQGPIRQVADATGGRVIRRAGDLAGELTSVVEDGHATYLLSFVPQGPADDQYHTIGVKLAGKQRGLTLRYRTGYLFAKEPDSLKDRFQQAVWKPRDVSEIAITAAVAPLNPGVTVKLNIVAGDLGLQQQAGRWMDKLDIFFIQRDDAGLRAQVEGQTLGLRLRSSTYQSLLTGGVPFEHSVQLKPGMASLRVLVVDENSGRMGSVTIPGPALGAGR
jgi:VWFA-related protein